MFRKRHTETRLTWEVTFPTTIAAMVAVALIVVLLGGCGGADENGGGIEIRTATGGTPPAGFTLTADKLGRGRVTSNPPGVDCGSDCTVQSATFASGSTVVLTASPEPGAEFSHWAGCDTESGNSCTVKVNDDRTVFATFATEVKLGERTKVLDEETMRHFIRQDGSSYYFDAEADVVANLKAGDVIVGRSEQGFLRKVTAVDVTRQQIVVRTAEATLEEAIEEGTIIFNKALTPADVASSPALVADPAFGPMMPSSSPIEFKVPIIEVEVVPGVTASGSLSFSAEPDIALEFKGLRVTEARAILNTTSTATLAVRAEAGFSRGAERTIWEQKLGCYWVPPPFPVVQFCPEVDVVVGVEGSAEAHAEVNVTQKNKFALGVRWDPDNGWRAVRDLFREPASPSVEVSAEAGFRAYAGPQVSVLIYNICGPYFSLEAFLRLSANPSETPWWGLYGGLGARAGIECEILAFRWEHHWGPWDIEWPLAEAKTFTLKVKKSGNGAVTSGPRGINCGSGCSEVYNGGWTVTLSAKPDPGWQVSWSGCDSTSGNTCTVAVNADRTVTASFTRPQEICDGSDNDGDGQVDEGFPNYDGDSQADCVDGDDDNDGVSDGPDQCDPDGPRSTELESSNGYQDEDGCWDEAPVTPEPVTPQPVTPQPVTPQPVTPQPVTPQPVTPQPVTPQPVTPQPVTPQPVTPQPVTPVPVTVEIRTDKSTYQVGEEVTFCTEVSRRVYVEIYITKPGQEPQLLVGGYTEGTECGTAPAALPSGQRTLCAYAKEGGDTVAQDCTAFAVEGALGSIYGVVDVLNCGYPPYRIVLAGSDGATIMETSTNGMGYYQFDDVPADDGYIVYAAYDFMWGGIVYGVSVSPGQTVEVNIEGECP